MLSPGAVAALFALLVSRCQRGIEFRDLSSCECLICLVFLSRRLFSRSFALVWFVPVRPSYLVIWCETYAILSYPYLMHV